MAGTSYTAIIEKEGDGYEALCPELDVASQGNSVEQATANLKEAVELFLECADPSEIQRRLHTEIFVTRFEAARGQISSDAREVIGGKSMKSPKRSKESRDFIEGIERALRRAAKAARKIARAHGTPIYVWENDKVVAKKP